MLTMKGLLEKAESATRTLQIRCKVTLSFSNTLAYQSYRLISFFASPFSNVVCTAFSIIHSCKSTSITPMPRISRPCFTAPAQPDQNVPTYEVCFPAFLMKLGTIMMALRPLPCLKAKALSHIFISSQFTLRSAVCR